MLVRSVVLMRGGRKPLVVEVMSRAAEARGASPLVLMPTEPPSRVLPPALGARVTFWLLPPAATVSAPVPVTEPAVTAPVKVPVVPLMLPVTSPVTLPLTLPERLPEMVPAAKLPELSRRTRVETVLRLVAVLANSVAAATATAVCPLTVDTMVAVWVPVTSPTRVPEKSVTVPVVGARMAQMGTVAS